MLLRLPLIAAVAAAILVDGSLAMAHDLGYPHTEPVQTQAQNSGGGASVLIIVIGVVLTLAIVRTLVWLKNRDFGVDTDGASSAAE